MVPQGFENGGANIVAIHPTLGEHHNFFGNFTALWKRIMEKRYLLAVMDEYGRGCRYTCSDNQYNTIRYLPWNEYIAANSMTFVDGKTYSISGMTSSEEGKGIEVHTTQFDDYIDLTGYTASDFTAPTAGGHQLI